MVTTPAPARGVANAAQRRGTLAGFVMGPADGSALVARGGDLAVHVSPCQSVSVRVSPWQSVSVRVSRCQSVSVGVSPWQSVSVRVSRCQSVSVGVSPCQSVSVRGSRCQSVAVGVSPWQSVGRICQSLSVPGAVVIGAPRGRNERGGARRGGPRFDEESGARHVCVGINCHDGVMVDLPDCSALIAALLICLLTHESCARQTQFAEMNTDEYPALWTAN
jgi:hypothetical protein